MSPADGVYFWQFGQKYAHWQRSSVTSSHIWANTSSAADLMPFYSFVQFLYNGPSLDISSRFLRLCWKNTANLPAACIIQKEQPEWRWLLSLHCMHCHLCLRWSRWNGYNMVDASKLDRISLQWSSVPLILFSCSFEQYTVPNFLSYIKYQTRHSSCNVIILLQLWMLILNMAKVHQ